MGRIVLVEIMVQCREEKGLPAGAGQQGGMVAQANAVSGKPLNLPEPEPNPGQ
jgi:hypothetical protein